MQIIIALLLMGNVESSLDLKSNEDYNTIKETIRVIRVVNGIK